jgi:20S proteasome subunit alpha 6
MNPFSCVCVRVRSNFMRQQAMASKMVFNRPVPVNRLVSTIADSALFPSFSLRASLRGVGEQFIYHTADA